ncbi:aromatic prenyltransferase [Zopfia rhizophila CBS 207.26]|uniref:Aromatic prenyltransferase n=1 Tax=Zopfia rhizophila CBS 207.26 TaxID=1314779 RepID=A0A6A6DNC5_9PEZI|nr:aromatic prenyltransferase [Zopfia rhizophila CBS 207.26]
MSSFSSPCFTPLFRCLDRRRDSRRQETKTSYSSPSDSIWWQLVGTKASPSHNYHQRFWWSTGGYVLGLLLHYAGYSPQAQYLNLKFFAELVTPALGAGRKQFKKPAPWFSFMTDDGTPIELSWDWGTKNKPTTVRFSIEPVGLHAGTSLDSLNRHAASQFHESVISNLPNARFEWFDHFKALFCVEWTLPTTPPGGHSSRIFYAFDLKESDVVAKAYFFPAVCAANRGQSSLEAISTAIETAPHCTPENLRALSVLQKFFSNPRTGSLELEMLATDLIDPFESRLKIYFRSRDTRFSSIANILSLNGLDASEGVRKGIENLRDLWNLLFGLKEGKDEPLEESQHRTSGVLYYATFRLGDEVPTVKLYIPVRHYAVSDESIMQGVKTFLENTHGDDHMASYTAFLDRAFSRTALRAGRGVHTYLGCSINRDGSLKLISYLNPQPWKLLLPTEGNAGLR